MKLVSAQMEGFVLSPDNYESLEVVGSVIVCRHRGTGEDHVWPVAKLIRGVAVKSQAASQNQPQNQGKRR